MEQPEKGEPKRPRPRSFIGGGNSGFAYDKHHGGIKNLNKDNETVERKPKRPVSLYEMFSKDTMMDKENSTMPSKLDGAKSPFQELDSQGKAEEMNKDSHKLKRRISSDRGEDGLGNRKMSDSGSRDAAKALYVELSSPPTITSPSDEKFNAVSKLRSLFDQGNSAPRIPRSGSGSGKQFPHQSSIHVTEIHAKDTGKPRNAEPPKRATRYEKIDMERKKKLFAPAAPIKLDDLLKRDSPRSPEEVTLPRLRKSFPLSREPFEKREPKIQPKSMQEQSSKKPVNIERNDFEEMHKKRRSLPKKRSSSFEFEGMEESVQVMGTASININAMLGLDAPIEDPDAEKVENFTITKRNEEKEESKKNEMEHSVAEDILKQENEPKMDHIVQQTMEQKVELMVEEKALAEEKLESDVEHYKCQSMALEKNGAKRQDALVLEPMVEDKSIEIDERSLQVDTNQKSNESSKLIVDEEIVDESKIKDVSLEEQFTMLDERSQLVSLAEEEKRGKDDIENGTGEEMIMPVVEESVESGLNFNALENIQVVSESNDSVIMECDSFDSFALHVKHDDEEVTEEISDSEISLIDRSVDESKNMTIEEFRNPLEERVLEEKMEDFELNESQINHQRENEDRMRADYKDCNDEAADENVVSCFEDGTKDRYESVTNDSSERFLDYIEKEDSSSAVNEEDAVGLKDSGDVFDVENENREDLKEMGDTGEYDDEEHSEMTEDAMHEEEDVECTEADDVEEAGFDKVDVPLAQLSIIASVAGLDKENLDEDGKEDREDDESHETVTLDDEEYDSDHKPQDKESSLGDFQTDESKYEHVDDREEGHPEMDTTLNASVVDVVLPPAPPHSCLSGRNGEKKRERKVSFDNERNNVILTYSAQEYNRSNAEIDALTASAEWELEKRVEEKDMFTVDLDKTDGGLGLSIIGLGVGTDSGVEKLGIFVKSLTPNGAAAKDRRVQVHDQILEVNGVSLVGVTQDFAANTLRNTSGKVRFLMGRDKGRRYYQAPTSTAEPVLQELERKHNLELGEMNARMQKVETRSAIAEHNLDEVREALAEAEERVHSLEEELADARNEIEHMKEKHERKSNEKIGTLERSISELETKLSYSEENLDKIQHESDEKLTEVQTLLEESENDLVVSRNENNKLVSTLEENSRKLAEAEECLAVANQNQESNLKEVQELRMKCTQLELEIGKLRETELELEQLKMSEAVKDVLVKQEERPMAAKNEADPESLRSEINHLSEEIALRNQFADIIVAERDSLKELVSKMEDAHGKQVETQEKKEIELAVKMMSYENKIKDLENIIKELTNQQTTDEKKHKKLFPDIEREIQIVKEIAEDSEDGAPIESGKPTEAQAERRLPFELPPRDYDGKDSPSVELTKFQVVKERDVKTESEAEKLSRPRKSSGSSSSSSEDENENASENVGEAVDHPKMVEIIKSAPIVETSFNVEETSPITEDNCQALKEATPVVPSDAENIAANESAISGDIMNDQDDEEESSVNPVQKPPRTYSEVSRAKADSISHPLKNKVGGTSSIDGQSTEVLENGNENEEQQTFVEVSESIKRTPSNKYSVVIEKELKIESRPFDEDILKDLPESSVDSDNEVIEGTERNMEATNSTALVSNVEDTAQKEVEKEISREIENVTVEDKNVENASASFDANLADSTAQIEGTAQAEGNATVESDSILDDQTLFTSPKKDDDVISELDRSSFMESFSKDPSFGSWFDGKMTILEHEKDDEHAEEIASKVVDGKERALSSSSSSSSLSTVDHPNVKEELNTSVKLDESYLQKSQVDVETDETDSPLNRMESVAIDSPLSEQSQLDDIHLAKGRPLSTDFDDLPSTEVLTSTAQHDKRKLASAIQRKSPKPISKRSLPIGDTNDDPVEPKKEATEESAKPKEAGEDENAAQIQVGAAAPTTTSTENLSVNIDYTRKDPDKEKRKSFFGFLTKLGGKKKHKRSMENLLAVDEANEGAAKGSIESPRGEHLEEEDGGVVPLEMQRDIEVRISTDSGVDTHQTTNGVSYVASDSVVSSHVSSPSSSHGISESDGGSSPPPRIDDEMSWINRPVVEWDVRQVGLWLIQLELSQYSQTFQERNIDGIELLNLNGARLKDIGVVNNDHRALIKRNIKDFKGRSENKSRDSRKEGRAKDKLSKKIFWKGKYTVNE